MVSEMVSGPTSLSLTLGVVAMGISLSILRGRERRAGSIGGKIEGEKTRVFTQISLGLFNM